MARRLQQGQRKKTSHSWSFHRSFAVLLGVVCLFEPLMAKRVIAQQPATNERKSDARAAKIIQLWEQAGELNRQGTKESRLKAIAVYEEALTIWRELKERRAETITLFGIGVNYYGLNENNKAIEYLKQALVIAQELKDQDLEASILFALGGNYSALGERQLSIDFYKGILENNLQPAAALRKAQVEMSQLPEWKSPYNWAGFVLQGEWK